MPSVDRSVYKLCVRLSFLYAVAHLPGGLPTGSAEDIDAAKAEFKAAWEALKANTTPEQLAMAYRAMNIRNED